MLELARCAGEAPVLMSALAEREDLSRKYLHSLLTALRASGLVRSVRGAGGGFVLTRHPSEIRLRDVLHALEGPLSLVDCVADGRVCSKADRCTARRVWRELSDAVENMLDSVTLEDLVAQENLACSRQGVDKGRSPRTRGRRSGHSRTTSRSGQKKVGKR